MIGKIRDARVACASPFLGMVSCQYLLTASCIGLYPPSEGLEGDEAAV